MTSYVLCLSLKRFPVDEMTAQSQSRSLKVIEGHSGYHCLIDHSYCYDLVLVLQPTVTICIYRAVSIDGRLGSVAGAGQLSVMPAISWRSCVMPHRAYGTISIDYKSDVVDKGEIDEIVTTCDDP